MYPDEIRETTKMGWIHDGSEPKAEMMAIHSIEVCVIVSAITDIFVTTLWVFGRLDPWLPRNIGRVTTLIFFASFVIRMRHVWAPSSAADLLCFLNGVRLWNRPRDDGPKRRKRKPAKRAAEEPTIDWTGAAPSFG